MPFFEILHVKLFFQKRNLLDTGHEGWFLGKNSSGKYGLFPGNYVLSSKSLAKASPSFFGVVEELVAKAKQSFGDLSSSDSEFQGMKILLLSSYFY